MYYDSFGGKCDDFCNSDSLINDILTIVWVLKMKIFLLFLRQKLLITAFIRQQHLFVTTLAEQHKWQKWLKSNNRDITRIPTTIFFVLFVWPRREPISNGSMHKMYGRPISNRTSWARSWDRWAYLDLHVSPISVRLRTRLMRYRSRTVPRGRSASIVLFTYIAIPTV